MNSLLKKQRVIISISMLIELLAIIAVGLLYIFVPSFNYYFYILLGMTVLFCVYDAALIFAFNNRVKTIKGMSEMKAAEILGIEMQKAFDFGNVGIVVCDNSASHVVIWANENFNNAYPDLVDSNICKTFSELSFFFSPDADPEKTVVCKDAKKNSYSVKYIRESNVFIFRDISAFEQLKERTENEAPVLGYIIIDNYADVLRAVTDENAFDNLFHEVRMELNRFALDYQAMLKRIEDDKYLFITSNANYVRLLKGRFKIVDDIRKVTKEKSNDIYFTASVGVAAGFTEFPTLESNASNALEVALSRGGDQTVVQEFDKDIQFIGGKTELAPSRNKVKIRQLSLALANIIRSYPTIIIMGHDKADFDAIGSSLGAYFFCKTIDELSRAEDQKAGRPVKQPKTIKVAWEPQLVDNKCRQFVENNFNTKEQGEIFVNMSNASPLIKPDSLLIVVDHNDPEQAMFPPITNQFSHVAIIDHHRPGDNVYSNVEHNNIDSSASSASELLAFYMQFYPNDVFELDKRTATFLLAGICLDTQFYRRHTTDSTFEASAYLKKFGANTGQTVEIFKEGPEEHALKISILNNHYSPAPDVMVCYASEDEHIDDVMISMVADEALSIKDINGSFCIARIDQVYVKVSCRSNGMYNMELIARKLGGGGHLGMAAAKIPNVSVADVKKRLQNILADYLDECRTSTYKEND